MYKKLALLSNMILMFWFFFDMIGLKIGNIVLVEQAWKEDFIFFFIYILAFTLFLVKDKYGKYFLTIWLSLWLIVQFSSHWYYTIFGVTERKLTSYNQFYSNTYHIVPTSNSMLVPDLYHILLHIFILFALFSMIIYCIKGRKVESK